MNTIREIEKINQQELDLGIAGTSASWHTQFANSAWCYLGNIDHQLTEGDILCIMSQFGEVEDIHLVRDEETGKSRGFAFLKYEDSRSCILAVDNLCGVLVLGRSLRVDHVEQYRLPKKLQEQEESKIAGAEQKQINDGSAGHAYKDMELENNYNIHEGMDLFAPPLPSSKNDNNNNKTKNMMKDKSNDEEHKKQEKLKRKEDRKRQREEKEQRKRRREEKREMSEEKKRQKRSHKHRRRSRSGDDDDSGSDDDNDNGDGEKASKRSDIKSKDTIDNGNDNDTERRRKERKRHRSNHSSSSSRSKNDKQDT